MIVIVPPTAVERKIIAVATSPFTANAVGRREAITVAPSAGPIAIVAVAAITVSGAIAPTLIVSVAVAIHKITIAIASEIAVTVEFSCTIEITRAIQFARAVAQVAIATFAEFTTVEIAAIKLLASSDVCPLALAVAHALSFSHLQEVAYLIFAGPTSLILLTAAKLLTRRPRCGRTAALIAAGRSAEL
jgi:hypothetical protein